MIKCLRCNGPSEPVALVVEKPLGNTLCEKCGNSMYNILEQIKLYSLDFYELSPEEQDYQVEQQQLLKAGEIVEGEIVEVFPEDITVTFEEIDNMNSTELSILAKKLGVVVVEGTTKDGIRSAIKANLKQPA